ncbi:MAG: class I SAM-dependent methyltransferase [Stellaceae bacterium]
MPLQRNRHAGPDVSPRWNPTEYYQDKKVAEEYDRARFSSFPAKVYLALERRCLIQAFTFAGVKPGTVILDAPCGTGRLAEILLQAGYNVAGADISAAMLQVAQRRLAQFGASFEPVVCDARRLTELGRHFDAALCARVLMHFPLDAQVEFLGGVAAVCDGPVVFTQSFDSGYQHFRRGVKRLLRHLQPASYPISRGDLDRLLHGAGLRLVRRYHLLPAVSEAMIVVAARG